MKKKNLLIIILILIISCYKINVEAASCTTEEKKALKQEAKAIEIIPNLDSDASPNHQYFYSVTFTNFNNKFYIIDSDDHRYEYSSDHTSDKLYGTYAPGRIITFRVYGTTESGCAFELLSTVRKQFDYYNDYYLSPLCKGIEEFNLCKRNYSGEIKSEQWFVEQINKYKASLEKTEVEEKELTFMEKVTQYLNDNPYIIVITVIVVIIILVIIIRKIKSNKNKIKLNFELK